MMNIEIITPTYASRDMPQMRNMTAEASTEEERTASKSASEPDAVSAPELTFFPCLFTYIPRISFTTMATEIIIIETAL